MRTLAAMVLVGVGGCVEDVTCAELAGAIASCDVRPEALRCDALAASDRRDLFDRLNDEGCAGLWTDGEVDGRACQAFDWPCPSPLGGGDALAPLHPLVFVGGIDRREDFDWNPSILDAVAGSGAVVHHVSLPPWSTTAERAAVLWERLTDLGEPRIHLVCYAVAGLDCRYVVSPQGLLRDDAAELQRSQAMIASITTVATPHRGTDAANAALAAAQNEGSESILSAVLGPESVDDEHVREALRGLTNEHASLFNRQVVDAPGVFYQSWAGVSHVFGQPFVPSAASIAGHCATPQGELAFAGHDDTRDFMTELLWATAPFSARTLTESGQSVTSPSDGMVSVDSAKWGAFRGCVPADHYDVIGRLDDAGPDPYTGFDAARFYVDLASELAGRGE